jgi:O-antigen/teichoic acid export membrane protein
MEFEGTAKSGAQPVEKLSLGARGRKVITDWTGRISGALLDQLSFSGCNFLINVLLARHMVPDDYGAYVVAYTWFQLAQNLYDAFVSEPLVIFGSGKFREQFRAYLGYAYRGHGMFSVLAVIALGIATLLAYQFDQRVVALALLGAALATPLILMRWLTKAPLYVLGRPHLGAVANAVYLGIVAGGIFALDGAGLLTPFSAMLLLGIGIATGALLITRFVLKPEWKGRDAPLYQEALSEHLTYGKWSTGYRILNWAPPSAITFLTSSLLGLASTGAYRALNGLVMPWA